MNALDLLRKIPASDSGEWFHESNLEPGPYEEGKYFALHNLELVRYNEQESAVRSTPLGDWLLKKIEQKHD